MRKIGIALLLTACGGEDALHAHAPASKPEPPREKPASALALGTDAPYALEDTDPEGRWIVLCQAREDTNHDGRLQVSLGLHGDTWGDRLRPYLIAGDGAGTAYDSYRARSSDGAYLAFAREGSLFLVDARGKETRLADASGASDRWEAAPHIVDFAARGAKVAYARRKAENHAEIVVRDIASGAEQVVDPGQGILGSIGLEGAGEWITVSVFDRDTDGDGKIAPGRRWTTAYRGGCAGPPVVFSVGGWQGDKPTEKLIRVQDGTMVASDQNVWPWREDLLRVQGGALVVEHGDEKRVLAPATCEAEIIDAKPQEGIVLASCHKKEVFAFFDDGKTAVRIDREPPGKDVRWGFANERLVLVNRRVATSKNASHTESTLVDPRTGRARPFARDHLLALLGTTYLVRRADGALAVRDFAEEGETVLAPHIESYPRTRGAIAAVAPYLVDIGQRKIIGRFQGPPLAVAKDGRLLFARERHTDRRLGHGPLWWEAAIPTP